MYINIDVHNYRLTRSDTRYTFFQMFFIPNKPGSIQQTNSILGYKLSNDKRNNWCNSVKCKYYKYKAVKSKA